MLLRKQHLHAEAGTANRDRNKLTHGKSGGIGGSG
jgi:hypothetical protein